MQAVKSYGRRQQSIAVWEAHFIQCSSLYSQLGPSKEAIHTTSLVHANTGSIHVHGDHSSSAHLMRGASQQHHGQG